MEQGPQPRGTPRLPLDEDILMSHGCFSSLLFFNRACSRSEPIRVEGIRAPYPEEKSYEKIEEEWDIVSPVNTSQEERS